MPLSLPHDVGHCWATQTVPILGPQDFDCADGIYHYAFWDCFCWQQPTIFRDLRDAGNWSKWGAATKKFSTRKSSRFAIYGRMFLYLETANSGFPFFVFSRICSSDFFTSGNEQYSSDIAHCKILNTTFGAMIIGCLSREATLMTYSICCTIGTVITFLSPAFSRVTTSNKPIWVWATSQTSQFGLIILLIYN